MLTVVLWQTLGLSLRASAEQSSLTHDMLIGLVSDLSRSALLTDDYADIQLYLEHVQKEPTVEQIFVTSTNDLVIAGIPPNMVGQTLSDTINSQFFYWRKEPISTLAGNLGYLVVMFSNKALEKSNKQVRNIGITIAISGMTVIAIVGIIAGFTLTRRLNRITDTALKFAHGDKHIQTGLRGSDEIAELGQTIDKMIKNVSEAQDHLIVQREKIQLLLDSTAEAIYGIDYYGNCTFANSAFLKLLKYQNEDEVIGQNIHTLIHHHYPDGQSYPKEVCPIIRSCQEGKTCHVDSEVFWCKDNSFVQVEYWAHPVYHNNKISGSVVTFFDITNRKQAEAELETYRQKLEELVDIRTTELTRINKELEAFSYSVSHDLRSPLRAIDGFSHALIEDYADNLDETANNYLNRVRSAAQKMGCLIDDLLQLSRITRSELNKTNVDLSKLSANILDRLQKADPERKNEITISPHITCKADRNLIRIALDNLLENAWKYSSKIPVTKIKFYSKQIDDETVFVISDNGAGFDMRYVGKLFGTFQRLHSDTDFSGTGIGLATVKRIIHLHGGRIWAEGKINQGASFFFTLGDNKNIKNPENPLIEKS